MPRQRPALLRPQRAADGLRTSFGERIFATASVNYVYARTVAAYPPPVSFARNQSTYNAGRNTNVSTVATKSPPMIA